MKKLKLLFLILLSFSVVIVACNKVEEKPSEEPKEEVEVVEEEPSVGEEGEKEPVVEDEGAKHLTAEFDGLYTSDDKTLELVKFIEENINQVDETTGTSWMARLEEKLISELESKVDKLFEVDNNMELMEIDGTNKYFTVEKVEEIQNEELKNLVKEYFETYHRLINVEGNFYPIIDYKKLSYQNEYIDEELGRYFEIMAKDSEEAPFSDGGRIISVEDLKNRIIERETYLNNYPDSIRRETIVLDYTNKLRGYMGGLPNTPIYDYDTSIIQPEIMESFEETATLENLVTGKILKKYVEDIKNNDLLIDTDVLDKVERYVQEAVDEIEKSR